MRATAVYIPRAEAPEMPSATNGEKVKLAGLGRWGGGLVLVAKCGGLVVLVISGAFGTRDPDGQPLDRPEFPFLAFARFALLGRAIAMHARMSVTRFELMFASPVQANVNISLQPAAAHHLPGKARPLSVSLTRDTGCQGR